MPVGRDVLGRLREHRLAAGRPEDDARVVGFDPRKQFARGVAAADLADHQRPSTPCAIRRPPGGWRPASPFTSHALPARRATAGERLERFVADHGGG